MTRRGRKIFYYAGAIFVGFFAGAGPITAIIFLLVARYLVKKGWIFSEGKERQSSQKIMESSVDNDDFIDRSIEGYFVSLFYIGKNLGIPSEDIESFIIREVEDENPSLAESLEFRDYLSRLKSESIYSYLDSIKDDSEVILQSLNAVFYPVYGSEAIRHISSVAELLGKKSYYENLSQDALKGSQDLKLKACFEMLGCDYNSSFEDIKKAYKKKISEFHPDKIQGKNLPDSFIKFANEEAAKINDCYDTIRKHKGL